MIRENGDGGSVSLADLLSEYWAEIQTASLDTLLAKVAPENLHGTWLNMGSGNGIYAEKETLKAGIQRVIHIDINPKTRKEYQAYLKDKLGSRKKAQQVAKENFIVCSVDELVYGNKNELLRGHIANGTVNGVMLLNPWPDITGLIWPTFEIAKNYLRQGQQLVAVADDEEWKILNDAAKKFWFTYERVGNSGIFTQTGHYLR